MTEAWESIIGKTRFIINTCITFIIIIITKWNHDPAKHHTIFFHNSYNILFDLTSVILSLHYLWHFLSQVFKIV